MSMVFSYYIYIIVWFYHTVKGYLNMIKNNFFAVNVKKLREQMNISQTQLGEAVGLKKQTINDIEHERSKTTLERAMLIADYFNVSIDYLVGRTDNPAINK